MTTPPGLTDQMTVNRITETSSRTTRNDVVSTYTEVGTWWVRIDDASQVVNTPEGPVTVEKWSFVAEADADVTAGDRIVVNGVTYEVTASWPLGMPWGITHVEGLTVTVTPHEALGA